MYWLLCEVRTDFFTFKDIVSTCMVLSEMFYPGGVSKVLEESNVSDFVCSKYFSLVDITYKFRP